MTKEKELSEFGEKTLEKIKEIIADGFLCDDITMELADLAVECGLIYTVFYDPEIHIDINQENFECEPGDEIYYWGRFRI